MNSRDGESERRPRFALVLEIRQASSGDNSIDVAPQDTGPCGPYWTLIESFDLSGNRKLTMGANFLLVAPNILPVIQYVVDIVNKGWHKALYLAYLLTA